MSAHIIKEGHNTESYPKTLVEVLENAAEYCKIENKGIYFINNDGSENFLSYKNLYDNAKSILLKLRSLGFEAGDLIIFQFQDDYNFINTFWACVLGGIVCVPLTLAFIQDEDSEVFSKLRNVCRLLDTPTIITDIDVGKKADQLKDEFKTLGLISFDSLISHDIKGDVNISNPEPDSLAFIQFSSGSTGDAKGVMLTHKNLVYNFVSLALCSDINRDDFVGNWMPYTHDMGLIGLHLSYVAAICNQFKLQPYLFVRNPLLFLEKVTKFRATHIGSPNFGISWMLDTIKEKQLADLDLSSLRIIYNGAEPISVDVARRFNKRFSVCGLNPNAMYYVYGMAEACVVVTTPPAGDHFISHKVIKEDFVKNEIAFFDNQEKSYIEVADVGHPVTGMEIQILDDNDKVLKEDQIGDIVIKGPNVTSGYYKRPDINKELFVNGFLRTGDVGFIHKGRLIITGRKKDIIFVNGQNFYSHDIEHIISSIPDLPLKDRNLIAVGVRNLDSECEDIIIFVRYNKSIEKFIPIVKRVKQEILIRLGISVTEVVPVKTIDQTTSGKKQRFKLRQQYIEGNYNDIINEIQQEIEANSLSHADSDIPWSEMELKLRVFWSEVLKIPQEYISRQDRFIELGGTSLKAMKLLGMLEDMVKTELSHDLLIKCNTIEDTADYLKNIEDKNISVKDYVTGVKEKVLKGLPGESNQYGGDIAVVGIALRFPDAKSPDEFWRNLEEGKCSVKTISEERKLLGKSSNWDDYLAYIDDVNKFDADFFNIDEKEASFIDPQQRLMLEIVYHALQDAHILKEIETENNVGVFIGASQNSYFEILRDYVKDNETVHPNAMVGNILNMLAARIAHHFNFIGPAITLDSACSSSLVALNYAIENLRNGKVKYAIAGGVNLILTETAHTLSKAAGILTKGDTCKVFDKTADGTILGEGIGVLVLEPLSQAVKKKHHVYGVIKGVAINNDGHSLGIMSPNPKGQFNVLVDAYKDAGIDPSTVSYVEAHGTGTVIGDNVELRGLIQLFRNFIDKNKICGIGSVKSNIGHLLTSAGIAGVIKTLLCIKNKTLVPSINVEQKNEYLEMEDSPFYLVSEKKKWETTDGQPLRAGVSSFGFGGTNAHVVIEEYNGNVEKVEKKQAYQLLTVSAPTEAALELNSEHLISFISGSKQEHLSDICFTHNSYREHFQFRKVFILEKGTVAESYSGVFSKRKPAKIRFDFQLNRNSKAYEYFQKFKNDPYFLLRLKEVLVKIKPLVCEDVDLFYYFFEAKNEARRAIEKLLENSGLQYLAYFVVQFCFTEMMSYYGLAPLAVSGDFYGELLAACIGRVMSFEDCVKILTFAEKDTEKLIAFVDSIDFQKPTIKFLVNDVVSEPGYIGAKTFWVEKFTFGKSSAPAKPKDRSKFDIQLSVGGVIMDDKMIEQLIAELYVQGSNINWKNFYSFSNAALCPVSLYQFDTKPSWLGMD